MKRGCLRRAAAVAVTQVVSCAGIPQDDRYQTHDGGRSNTRAEAPSQVMEPPGPISLS